MDKIQISRISEDGFYIEPVLTTQQEIDRHLNEEDDFTLGNVVIDEVPEGLHNPKWHGTEWVESKPNDEILVLVKQQKMNEIKGVAESKIIAIAPVWKQVNTLRGAGKTDPIFTDIDAIRNKSDEYELQVTNATTIEEVKSIIWE